MVPRDVPVKLSVLAEMTGFGYSTLHKHRKSFASWKRGAWVASYDDYLGWVNGETSERRGDNQEDSIGQVPSSNQRSRDVGERAKRGEKSRRAESTPDEAKGTEYAWITRDGIELSVQVHK